MPTLLIPEVVSRLDDPEMQKQIREWPVVVFEPTEETCPDALPIDLLWAWPLILIVLAVKITLLWLISREK